VRQLEGQRLRGGERLLKLSVCWDAACCAVSAGGFLLRTCGVANLTIGAPSYRPCPLELFSRVNCAGKVLNSPVLPCGREISSGTYDVALIAAVPRGYVGGHPGATWPETFVVEKDPYLAGPAMHFGCFPPRCCCSPEFTTLQKCG